MSKQKKIEIESSATIMLLHVQILIFHESSKISPYGKTINK